jgi:glucose-1-phosphate cytidylyltransferase
MVKAVILAGGLGSRLSEETENKPKPMIEIGEKPILWHIMKIYSNFGINDFIICSGYKSQVIKNYFANFFIYNSDITFDIKKNSFKANKKNPENWKVTVVDTGLNTMTGGRIKKIKNYLKNEKFFCLTYGDGLADINILKLINFHKKHGKLATLTATRPQARFGALNFSIKNKNLVNNFKEKPEGDQNWINGGFFVLSPKVIDRIKDDTSSWELEPLDSLAKDGELLAYKHLGFWRPMDILRDKIYLNNLWNNDEAPWKIWK